MRFSRSSITSLVVCAVLTTTHCQTARQTSARFTDLEQLLDRKREELHIPGIAFAIVENDRLVFLHIAGQRNIEANLPVTADTLFPIGSCTKAFTSMAVALSADRGLLSFDDHPRKFLPYFKLVDPEADARVTLRDALGHSTGLKTYGDLAAEPGILTREEYIRAATGAKPAVPFRTKFQYSNAMYVVAGEAVAKANRTTWENLIRRDIFGPLGMSSSRITLDELAAAPNHVTGYTYDAKTSTFHAPPLPKSLLALAPGGSVSSTAHDMTRWLRVLTSGGRGFVSEKNFRQLTTPNIAISPSISYALGWATYDWNGLRVVEHNGGSQGMSAMVSFIPERRVGFVFMANVGPTEMTRVKTAGEMIWPLILRDVRAIAPPPVETPAPTPAASTPPADLPTPDALIERMIDAAGGRAALLAHTSQLIHARKSYDNHGIFVDLTIARRAPAAHAETELWTAAGRDIGRIRIFFDGSQGGQLTTFGQDSTNDEEANLRARREYAFHRLIELRQLYPSITVQKKSRAGEEDAWVVELKPTTGASTTLYVSATTGLILQRESGGETTTFTDYRSIDGEMVPFHTTIHDALGETTILVDSVRFNEPISDDVFRP